MLWPGVPNAFHEEGSSSFVVCSVTLEGATISEVAELVASLALSGIEVAISVGGWYVTVLLENSCDALLAKSKT